MNKVYLDAGHGGKDGGAISGGFVEKTLNLKVANQTAKLLKDYEVTVYQNRTDDATNTTINNMCTKAKEFGANLYVSVHHNAGGGTGHEVFYWYNHAKSKEFAKLLDEGYKKVPQKSRGIKESKTGTSYNFGVCRINASNGIPAVLSEFAFVDNATDQKMIDSDAKLQKEAQAICDAVVKFLNLKKKSAAPTAPTVPTTPSTSKIAVGSVVKIADNATYYDGKTKIPSWVLNTKWIVKEIKGDRAIIDKSQDGKNSINSPINTKFLSTATVFKPYIARVTAIILDIRKEPFGASKVVGIVAKNAAYTITEERSGEGSAKGWGKLKSGAGWISLDYIQFVRYV